MSDTWLSAVLPAGVQPVDVHRALGKSDILDHRYNSESRVLQVRVVDEDVSQTQLDAAVKGADTSGDLARYKAAKTKWVNDKAEELRLLWLTPGEGQAQEYIHTDEELVVIEGDQDPDPENYLMLTAEKNALFRARGVAVSLPALGDTLRTLVGNLKRYAADIKEERRTAVMRIEDATDKDSVDAAIAEIEWPELQP